ncbi:putative Bromodomain-containing protein [Melia azedarach]|uniref:Bromodomain-containing protein n=1 Tax=Melia azedarach TaxID=155640 RepID=A0ACC1Y355_MELAZ|nr:putative Bromodomain-containing protein [Melia azedarach]
MKRKRGHKKGKSKGGPKAVKNEATPVISLNNTEDDSNNVDEYGNDEYESVMEVDTPSSTGTDQPLNVASIKPDGSVDKALGKPVGRVKVKLKTPKILESSHSDTDKSSSQMGFERQSRTADRMEDSAISLAQMKLGVLGNASKKAGSIKIKSSKGLGPCVDRQYNKEELDAALTVIKKVMKMDAAEPFNAPVNAEALGIPDYFDVIDTPMDFGTICNNLESSDKYMNSEDVYKDVQYIWENCNKYNNKGDYILDLMKRVKKNFMKYWTAAGLYIEQSSGSGGAGVEGNQDVAQSSHGKVQVKGGQPKQKSGKRHGRRHKHDCLCAICVLKRRKREREESARIAKGQIGVAEAQELKQEESSPIESPQGDDSSSDMGESQDLDADAEVEGKSDEVKMERKHEEEEDEEEDDGEDEEEEEDEGGEENEIEMQRKGEGEASQQSKGEESMRHSELGRQGKSGGVQTHSQEHDEETAGDQKQTHKKLQEWEEKAKMYSNVSSEDPKLLNLCGILFPKDRNSVWNGPHSLVQQQVSAHTNSVLAAIESFMQ